jgi:hypothetical protein
MVIAVKKLLAKPLKYFLDHLIGFFLNHGELRRRLDINIEWYWAEKKTRLKNPLNQFGEKYYSQNDEDGILLEVVRRLGIVNGVFVEYGCGNGLENNSIILLMSGWSGTWIGNVPLMLNVPIGCRLSFLRTWVTKDNCYRLMSDGLSSVGADHPNIVSVDLDGNDYHIVSELLKSGVRPDVFVVEYNGKFPPPIRFQIQYDVNHVWDLMDYFGASIQSLVDLFDDYEYSLVCCNLTGTNAFFISTSKLHLLPEIPKTIDEIFVPSDYNWFLRKGHKISPKTIETFLAR